MLTREGDLSIFEKRELETQTISYVWICDRPDDDFSSTFQRYVDAIQSQDMPGNLIVVNNALGDRVSHQLAELLKDTDIKATLINFHAKTPESSALSLALKEMDGDVVVLLPAYPQSDPRDVGRMIDVIRDGSDYVASWRTPRVDSKKEQRRSWMFNALTRWFTGLKIHDINSGLRVMRKEVIASLPLYGDLHVYLPILAERQGFRVSEVPVRHLEERPSVSGHVLAIYVRRLLDLLSLFFLMRFTQKPFRFFGGIGTGLLASGGLINLVLAIQKVVFSDTLADRPMLVLATLLMVLGIQMFSLGLIGELIIFVSAGGVKDYQIEHVYESKSEE